MDPLEPTTWYNSFRQFIASIVCFSSFIFSFSSMTGEEGERKDGGGGERGGVCMLRYIFFPSLFPRLPYINFFCILRTEKLYYGGSNMDIFRHSTNFSLRLNLILVNFGNVLLFIFF